MTVIPNILQAFISGLNLSFSPVNAVFDGTSTMITLDSILHARAGMPVTIVTPSGSSANSVSEFDHTAETVTVGGDVSDLTSVTLQTPFFFHGTPYATNAHISRLDDVSKVPMIYLYEIIRETFGDRLTTNTEAEVKLFFLDVANFSDWTTDDHYSNVIQGQEN